MTQLTDVRAAAPGGSSGPPARKPWLTQPRRELIAGYLFTSPQVIGYFAVVVVPMVALFWYSFQEFSALSGRSEFAGTENYQRLLDDPNLPTVLRSTGIFVIGLVALGVPLALFLAVLVNQRIRGIRVFRAIFFAPALVSVAAWVIVWQFMLLPDGAVNGLLRMISVDGPNWLREPVPAMVCVIVVQALKGVGINMLIFLAALQGVPKELTEAARVDGAGRLRTFRSVTLPMISPEILMVTILMTIGSLKVFAQVLLLTEGGPGYETTVLAYYIYRQAFGNGDFGYAGALSVLLFLVLVVLTGVMWVARKRVVFHESE
ncbi:carbohydrate ABC transporter permease [Jiangella anatolica]|uniref:Sugar ABC transporter permease n=1 Tax=Jiangella anatolica TaxID=2670374 RepID=A0A2W2B430_9ACTN|nr:sugar ABC transporter permease [Jiangella anatolica]PZF82181.1 sugar ABC transporter permease [Jiangella anatolica]